jgi:hypothetical protein
MHAKELLRTDVVGLKIVVADGPARRYASSVLDVVEIVLAESRQRGAVDLGVPANEIVDAG